jgi:amino acid transporter
MSAKKEQLPSLFGKLHPRLLSPVNALLLHAILSSLMILLGNFRFLMIFLGVAEWFWFLVILSIIRG